VSAAIAPGEVFASYRIEAVVDRGGMGVVYRATDLRLDRPVALKLVAPELAGAPPAPTVLVRRGPRPGGLAPDGTRTRFGWSLTGAGA